MSWFGSWLESGGGGEAGVAEAERLEQTTHAPRFGEALGGVDEGCGAFWGLGAGEGAGALEEAKAGQEGALLDGAVDADAVDVGLVGDGAEVDMGGEVRLAGVGEGVGGVAVPEGLEGGEAGGLGVAVIEEEGGAGILAEAVG